MQWPSTRSDCLRAIGHVLDEVRASQVHIEEGDTLLDVRYAAAGGEVELRYPTSTVERLLDEARARRGTETGGSSLGYEQKLRVIGGELDRSRGRNVRIREHEGSFGANYITREGGRVNATYLLTRLEDLIETGPRRRRQAGAGV